MRRLILFDIDGTLVWGGPARDAFEAAMMEVFGTAGDIDGHDFSGKTDPQIARELLEGVGFATDAIESGLPRLWGSYLRELEERLPGRPVDVLPGVPALLEALREEGNVGLGLVTGNIHEGARLKLSSAGLYHHFAVGGYGSDSEVRDHLPGVAIERAEEEWRVSFTREQVIVVGDTAMDVASGRHAGTRTLAVATGHRSVEELTEAGPDWVLDSFADVEAAVGLLTG
ncbi:MAG: HAD hydrolase-like protein [Gemmatimonadetes bacterium]|nr:HAD hydrolase-like protein [Gemmatimonadota bacterium]